MLCCRWFPTRKSSSISSLTICVGKTVSPESKALNQPVISQDNEEGETMSYLCLPPKKLYSCSLEAFPLTLHRDPRAPPDSLISDIELTSRRLGSTTLGKLLTVLPLSSNA